MKGLISTTLLGVFVLTGWCFSQDQKSCLIVRQAEGHRFRNGMIAGALTGGIGLGLGIALSGGRYEYVDATNFTPKTLKYKDGELRKLQDQGLHVIVVNKKATAEEIQAARQLSDSVLSHKPGERVAIRFRRDSTIYDTYLIVGRSDF